MFVKLAPTNISYFTNYKAFLNTNVGKEIMKFFLTISTWIGKKYYARATGFEERQLFFPFSLCLFSEKILFY